MNVYILWRIWSPSSMSCNVMRVAESVDVGKEQEMQVRGCFVYVSNVSYITKPDYTKIISKSYQPWRKRVQDWAEKKKMCWAWKPMNAQGQ